MKKLFMLLAVMFLSLSLFAQEHLDFRGVPIDGHLNDFIPKMEKLGYTLKKRDGDIAIMTGKFTNKNAELWILSTPNSKTVWKVFIDFDKATSWSSLKSSYYDYKDLYTTKYGTPTDSFEFFTKPYYEGDGYELQALKNEKCTYATYYKTSKGFVVVKLTEYECLRLAYEDKINVELKNQEQTSSALNEI